MEAEICDMSKSVPCRRQQLTLLSSLLCGCDVAIPALFLYGHTATGKTITVKTVLQTLSHQYISINCVECYSSRLLFETILNSLCTDRGTPCSPARSSSPSKRRCSPIADSVSYSGRCDSINEFVHHLKSIVAFRNLDSLYILLERAERLRDADANLLPALLRLHELSNVNVGVIMESEIVWEKFRSGTGFQEPLVVHFPDYKKEELLEIMTLDAPAGYTMEVYSGYVNLLLSVFHLACRNLNELRYLALVNFSKYMEPVEKGEATVEDSRKLWRGIEPQLKKALQTVYLREVSGSQISTATPTQQTVSSRANIELPVYSKFLIIAAYIASYNPAKSDKRFFSKKADKMSKRSNYAKQKRNERTSNQLLGPKFFPLDRLMAVFYSIVEARVAPTANIFSQITSLVSLGLVAQSGSSDPLESPKYKCLVSLDFIKAISRSVNFEVVNYIYDLV